MRWTNILELCQSNEGTKELPEDFWLILTEHLSFQCDLENIHVIWKGQLMFMFLQPFFLFVIIFTLHMLTRIDVGNLSKLCQDFHRKLKNKWPEMSDLLKCLP